MKGGGIAIGANEFFGSYQLGGTLGEGYSYVSPEGRHLLRGYPEGTDIGDMYWITNAEYRFPLIRVDRGIGTIPIFFRTLSGAVFVDSGNAFTAPQEAADIVDDTLLGVGAELSLSSIVGWSGGFNARVGYAAGLTNGGYSPLDLRTIYLEFGGSY